MTRMPVRRACTAALAAGLALVVPLVAGVAPASAAGKTKTTTVTGGTLDGGSLYGGSLYGGSLYGGSLYGGSLYGGSLYGGTLT